MSTLPNRRLAYFELHFAVFLFGTAGLFGKLISASPIVIVLGRSACAALAIFAGLKLARIPITTVIRKNLAVILLSGLVLAVHWLTFFHAIQMSTVAIGLIGYATFPLFVTFLEPLISNEKIRGVDLLSAMLVLAGLLLVAPSMDLGDSGTVGLLWSISSGALFAVLTLLNRRLVVDVHPMTVSFYQHSMAALVLIPFFVATRTLPDSNTLWLLLILGVVCTALPHTLFIKSLQYLKAQVASVVSGLEPIYAIALAAVFLDEIPNTLTVAGAALVLGAVFLAIKAHANSDNS